MLALVVDDSRAMRSIVGEIARDLGYETAQAADGVEAMQQIGEGCRPDLMLVDWNMPNMDGLELVTQVRRDPEMNDTVIVMVTTESESSHVVSALNAGANEYVMKPFTREILSEKLQTISVFRGLL